MWHNEIGVIYEGDWIVLLNPNGTTILLKLRNSYYWLHAQMHAIHAKKRPKFEQTPKKKKQEQH